MIPRQADPRFNRCVARVQHRAGHRTLAAAAERHICLDGLVVELDRHVDEVAVAEVRRERRQPVLANRNVGHLIVPGGVRHGLADDFDPAVLNWQLVQVGGDSGDGRDTVNAEERAGHRTDRVEHDGRGYFLARPCEIHACAATRSLGIADGNNRLSAERHIGQREVSRRVRRHQAQAAADARARNAVAGCIEHHAFHDRKAAGNHDIDGADRVRCQLKARLPLLQRCLIERRHAQAPRRDTRDSKRAICIGRAERDRALPEEHRTANALLASAGVVDDDGKAGEGARASASQHVTGDSAPLHHDGFRAVGRQKNKIA